MAKRKPTFTPEQIREALEEAARENFRAFALMTFHALYGVPFDEQPLHQQLWQMFDDIEYGRAPHTVWDMPPRSGKSFLCACFTAFTMMKYARTENIVASYGEQLSDKFAMLVQQILGLPVCLKLFGPDRTTIDPKMSSKALFATLSGAICRSVGCGSATTGFGAGLTDPTRFGGWLVVDDLLKQNECRSESARREARDFLVEGLMTRLNDAARTPVLICAQRLHPDDPSGYALAQRTEPDANGKSAPMWKHVHIPAWDEANDRSTWENRWPTLWCREKAYSEPFAWTTQYLGQPFNQAGSVFMVDRIATVSTLPVYSDSNPPQRIRSWDLASSTGPRADWSVGVRVSWDGSRCFIEDLIRFRGNPHEVKQRMLATARSDGLGVKIRLSREPGQAGDAQVADLLALLAGFVVIPPTKDTGDKWTRAQPFASAVGGGLVSVLDREWVTTFIDELRQFDGEGSGHDDIVDAASNAYQSLTIKIETTQERESREARERNMLAMRAAGGDREAQAKLQLNPTGWAKTFADKAKREDAERRAAFERSAGYVEGEGAIEPVISVLGPQGVATARFGPSLPTGPEIGSVEREEADRQASNQRRVGHLLGFEQSERGHSDSKFGAPLGVNPGPRPGDRSASEDDGQTFGVWFVTADGNRYRRDRFAVPAAVTPAAPLQPQDPVSEILRIAESAGFQFWADGNRLQTRGLTDTARLNGPSPALEALRRQHQGALVAHLRRTAM